MSLRNHEKTVSAVRLRWPARVFLTVIGVVSVVGILLLVLLFRRGELPDLLLTTLAIGALGSFLFAVVGRLPSGFEVAGMKFDFPEDRLADLIGTVKSALDHDPGTRARILELIKDGAGAESFNAAETWLERPHSPSSQDARTARTSHPEPSPPTGPTEDLIVEDEQQIVERLETLADHGEVQRRFEVVRSGRGKAPIFDYYFERHGAGIAVEVERYSNPSTVDLMSRKTDRALRKTTDVNGVVVVAPDQGVAAFSEMIEASGALVVRSSDLRASDFGERLDELLSAGR